MIREDITLVKLTASEGMVLTNGESYGKTVYLGALDPPENWHEIEESEVPQENEEMPDEEMDVNGI